ncbi:unnamed protein product [Moneuplotes crassus]|uniref:AtPDCT1/2 transmembrane domain-containing protein n=1 Tax=Euplotes crassus TaxID=5936 RepID=A0AAD1XHQ5_EUPCR|nr:unnamed protein product [Moneuplotes crassus]
MDNNTTRNYATNEEGFHDPDLERNSDESYLRSSGQSSKPQASIVRSGQPSRVDFIGKRWTQFSLRVLVLVVVVITLIVAASFPGILPKEDIECIKDVIFEFTWKVNQFFDNNTSSKHAFMIVCGLAMDITVLGGLLTFVFKGKTWRLPIVMTLFYLTRLIIQKLFLMKFPEGYLWDNPGFPSLTVPYGKTNDFFYSGHVGGAVIMILEFRERAKEEKHQWLIFRILQAFAIITVILQILLMIFLRSHYTIDLFAGALAAHYFFILVSDWMPFINTVVCRLKKKEDRTSREEIKSAISHDTFTEDYPQDAHSPLMDRDEEDEESQYFRKHSGSSIN